MLGQIANYSPIISRNSIVKNSTSINGVWQAIRQHYGLQSTGSRFLDLAYISPKPEQRPEDLFQGLMAFVEDNLLTTSSGITHHGEAPVADEELSPSLENFIVLTWLRLLHPNLPRLVKQRYGTELRCRSLASVKPEISQALDSLLDELHTSDQSKILRSASQTEHRASFAFTRRRGPPKPRPSKVCPLCQQARRPDSHSHFLSNCKFLPESDRLFMSRIRQVAGLDVDINSCDCYQNSDPVESPVPLDTPVMQNCGPGVLPTMESTVSRRVNISQSPFLHAFFRHHPLRLTIDTGAETNMMRASLAKHIGAKVTKSTQTALQADGRTPLSVVGETRLQLVRRGRSLMLEALVVEDLDVDILAGAPFMTSNDIAVRPSKHEIIIAGCDVASYDSSQISQAHHAVRACHLLRAPCANTTVWPGEFLEVDAPSEFLKDSPLAIEPRTDSVSSNHRKPTHAWPQPVIVQAVGGKLRLLNDTDELLVCFRSCQEVLTSNKSINLPKPEDQLWIVTDGSVKMSGLGATLYVLRNQKLHLAGFFSAKFKKHEASWLPCEIEALSIAAAVKHFAPYIIQAKRKSYVLTDSKPCVQAFEKLCRGQFSSSPRVTSFLSAVSRYQVSLLHLAGSANLPSDFASRNAPACDVPHCQVCSFVSEAEDLAVRPISVQDVLSGQASLPFTSRAAWLQTQLECPYLRRVHSHLKQGTRPSKKLTNIKDVKRYLNSVSISRDCLLVVRRDEPFSPSRECIVIPRSVIDGFLAALHVKLDHPSRHQMKLVTQRYFFALDLGKALDRCSQCCHLCSSLKKVPSSLVEQSTSDPPDGVGISFAADIIKRYRQLILVVRETSTSFTATCLLDDERRESIRIGLLRLCLELRPLAGPPSVVRVDPAPGFSTLSSDETLRQYGLALEVGRIKNPNKTPVAEKCIAELGDELLRICPGGGPISPLSLAVATANLNTSIRNRGLSAREMWLQCDQFTNWQIPVTDLQLLREQHSSRLRNHPVSERSKAPGRSPPTSPSVEVGDLVYITSDGSKNRARDRYLVVSVEGLWCNVLKFTSSQLRSTSYRVKRS